ncbi:MAG: hypothetical protein GXP26_15345 [Planctomycetes bacterium]|nr:hypothetical protein [Planctomycetota bacterium]
MQTKHSNSRIGFTLLELAVASGMLSVLTVSCMVLVGTSYDAWNRHEDDHAGRQAGLAVLRHLTRHVRQSKSVMAISSAKDTSGSLSVTNADGQILVWDHDAGTKEVRFGMNTATDVLATGIEEFSFVGIKNNGWETTTAVGEIYSVQCTTTISLPHLSGPESITTSSQAWLRAW